VVGNFSRDIAGAVQKLLEPEHYAQYRDRAAADHNGAVYEIPEILESVLEEVSVSRPYPGFDFGAQSHRDSAHLF
jgi:hypothetical protein